jgi:hypothetical protein
VGESSIMPAFAPRISWQLLEALVRLDDRTVPIAEVNRRLGREAWRFGLARPSYQRVRVLVHLSRRIGGNSQTTVATLFEVAVRARPPTALLDHVSGIGVQRLR